MKFDPISSLKKFNEDVRHVVGISYKPNMDTFMKTLKVVLIGTLLIGLLGYIISVIIGFLVV